jgi:hypothetical protein
MTFMSIQYEPMKIRFCMIIIAKLGPKKFVKWSHFGLGSH